MNQMIVLCPTNTLRHSLSLLRTRRGCFVASCLNIPVPPRSIQPLISTDNDYNNNLTRFTEYLDDSMPKSTLVNLNLYVNNNASDQWDLNGEHRRV